MSRKVYHYFHNMSFGSTEVEEEEGGNLRFRPLVGIGMESYNLPVDPRDKRTLVAFDGHIPWGGIPKSGSVVGLFKLPLLVTPIQSLRKHKEPEEQRYDDYFLYLNATSVFLMINRYFLLLPKSVACVRKYDSKSFRPIYVFIEVNEKGVTWRTSSY